MKLSVTAVSANRRMTKTLVRARAGVDRLRQAWSEVNTADLQFDTIQFVLMDRSHDYIHLQGTGQDDRLFQVYVGANSLPCDSGQEEQFTLDLARVFQRAIAMLPIPHDTIEVMRTLIEYQKPNKPRHDNPS